MSQNAPSNLQHLQKRVSNLAKDIDIPAEVIHNLIAKQVISELIQMSSSGSLGFTYVKGGSAVGNYVGIRANRSTKDLDLTVHGSVPDFLAALENLNGGSTFDNFGVKYLGLKLTKSPDDVPTQYHVETANIQVLYKDAIYSRIEIDVARDELNESMAFQAILAPEVVEVFTRLGIGEPVPVRTITPEYQVAQKLHALSHPDSDRAKDLYDIWALSTYANLDIEKLSEISVRLFSFRRTHQLPADLGLSADMQTRYSKVIESVDGAPTWDQANETANTLLSEISTRLR